MIPVARAGVVAITSSPRGSTEGLKDVGANIGGTTGEGTRISMTSAIHSSGVLEDGHSVYLGEPAGFVVGLEDGRSSISRATPRCSATCA